VGGYALGIAMPPNWVGHTYLSNDAFETFTWEPGYVTNYENILFDRDGGFLASGRAALDSPALIPGGESPFAVIVRTDGDVARYRISFRSGDRIVAHVDRRAAASEGTTP